MKSALLDMINADQNINPSFKSAMANGLREEIKWISVRDEFPEGGAIVLVSLSCKDQPTWFAFTDGKTWFDPRSCRAIEWQVTHWAELPIGVRA